MNTVGIDFGTTKTLVATVDGRSGKPVPISLGRAGYEIPTTLHVDARRQILFGDDADDHLATDRRNYLSRIKRDLGRTREYVLAGHRFTSVDLAAEFLGHIRERLESEYFHGRIDHAVVTVPAKFGPAARKDLETAVGRAGFASFELLDEPIAAGIAFLEEKRQSELGEEVLVFDWGGGTLDIALVEHRDGTWNLNHDLLEGDPQLGGEDIDDSILDAVNRQMESAGHAPIEPDHQPDHSNLVREVVKMKRLLSKKESHAIRLHTARCEINLSCRREDFEDFISGELDRAFRCLANWERKAQVAGKTAGKVLLVGGTSQIPAVAKRFAASGMKPLQWTDSLRAVALGAAVRAASTALRETTLQEEAERGDLASMVKLGIALMNGEGMETDHEKGFFWLYRAAQLGHANAMNWTGYCYEHGKGVPKNLSLASQQYQFAADQGNPEGMYRLGFMYSEGRGLPKSTNTAIEWFRKAAAVGHESASHALAALEKAEKVPEITPQSMEGRKAGEVRVFGGIEMVWCPPGSFMMGSPPAEEARATMETLHSVTLSEGFWMAISATTQGQWMKISSNNPSTYEGVELPVHNVGWNNCQEWLEEMNRRNPLPEGWAWNLPTEAQWEYACRAGTETEFSFGSSLNGSRANCDGRYPYGTAEKGPFIGKVVEVRRYSANAWGLHDMHGNVYEWCRGWHGPYSGGAVIDPQGPTAGTHRVCRGGNWYSSAAHCRSARRYAVDPNGNGSSQSYIGFRVVAERRDGARRGGAVDASTRTDTQRWPVNQLYPPPTIPPPAPALGSEREKGLERGISSSPMSNQGASQEQIEEEMYAFAAEKMEEGISTSRIQALLIERGLDRKFAAAVVSNLVQMRSEATRKAAQKDMLYGALKCIGVVVPVIVVAAKLIHDGRPIAHLGPGVLVLPPIVLAAASGADQFFRGLYQLVKS